MGQEALSDLLLTSHLGAGLIMSGESTAVLQTTHASPLGIPSEKKRPAPFLNFFLPKIGQIILEDMSEVLGVGSF